MLLSIYIYLERKMLAERNAQRTLKKWEKALTPRISNVHGRQVTQPSEEGWVGISERQGTEGLQNNVLLKSIQTLQ